MRSGNPRSQKQIKVEEGRSGASIFGKERVGQILVVSQSLLERRSSAYRNSTPTILEKDRTSIAARKIKEARWGVTVSKSSCNTSHSNQLGWQMFCIYCIDTSKNNIIDCATHTILNFHHLSLLRLYCIWLSPSKNWRQHLFMKFFWRTYDTWICEIHHSIELLKIILGAC